MRKTFLLLTLASLAFVSNGYGHEIRSMGALAFGPEGILFVGDGKAGAVFAVDLNDRTANPARGELNVTNLEGKIAGFLGTSKDDVLIHDMAVNPISQNVYLAVSRGRGQWDQQWLLPNDIADANVLVRVDPKGGLSEVAIDGARVEKAALPNPVSPDKKHAWKEGIALRTDTITDMYYCGWNALRRRTLERGVCCDPLAHPVSFHRQSDGDDDSRELSRRAW